MAEYNHLKRGVEPFMDLSSIARLFHLAVENVPEKAHKLPMPRLAKDINLGY